jgi:glycosyltransferase involved in cell wall biosynthesis
MAISGEGVSIPYQIVFESEDNEAEIEGLLESRSKKKSTSQDFVSFVIPTYNEGENIFRNLQECLIVVRKFGLPFEMVVVNDGSTDNTLAEIERFADNHPEIVPVTYVKNAGKGNALRSGIRRSRGNLVVFLDADMEIHPSQTSRFIDELRRNNADVVIGSKRHPESKVDYPKKRQFLSWGYHLMIKVLFNLNLTDTQPGFKLFKKEVLDKEIVKVEAQRYAFDLDLLAHASADGYKIVEAPIELRFNRRFGGRIGFKTVKSMFTETLGIYFRLRIKKQPAAPHIPVAAQPTEGGPKGA